MSKKATQKTTDASSAANGRVGSSESSAYTPHRGIMNYPMWEPITEIISKIKKNKGNTP